MATVPFLGSGRTAVPADRISQRLDHIRVILSRPRDSKNVGAVCRAMKNMGLTRLYIVGFPGLDREKAAVLALHASDVLEDAVETSDLPGALEGCSFVAGLTRRWGKNRKYAFVDPPGLCEKLLHFEGRETALVFGNEVSGLSDEEVRHCHVAVTIPSSDDFPSLNLSHAVQVIGYEVYNAFRAASGRRFYTPVSGKKLDSLVEHITDSLFSLGFFKLVTPDEMGRFFRDIFTRASLSGRESDRIKDVFSKIAGIGRKRAERQTPE
jgi:TrmH family RNA methyltransferase